MSLIPATAAVSAVSALIAATPIAPMFSVLPPRKAAPVGASQLASNKESARDLQLMCLLRTLLFFSAVHDFTISARHIAGSQSVSADALSRNNIPLLRLLQLRLLQPYAQVAPSRIPLALWQLGQNRSLHWTSPEWTKLFAAILRTVSHHPVDQHMPLPSSDIQPSARRQL